MLRHFLKKRMPSNIYFVSFTDRQVRFLDVKILIFHSSKTSIFVYCRKIWLYFRSTKLKQTSETQISFFSSNYLLLWALSVGSRRNTTRLFDAHIGPESTSWITIFIASPSIDVCRRGASKSSKAGGWNTVGFKFIDDGIAPLSRSAAISGL